jgi:hypothetical protein
MEEIIQDGITYRVDNGVIKGWLGQSPFKKPLFDNGVIIEGWTQADTDAQTELEEEIQFLQETIEQLEDANNLALDIFSFVRKHSGLTTNQRGILKSLAILLFQGDIEQAKTNFDAIQRPTEEGKMQKVYDRLKLRFDNL